MDTQDQLSTPTIGGNPSTSPELVEGQSVKSPYGKRNWVKWALALIAIAAPLVFLIFILGSISGIYMGNSYLDGVVVDHDTKAPIPEVNVVVSNRGWGFSNGRPVWDKDYEYSSITDQSGRFHIVYHIGPSAHVIVNEQGYERYDNWLDRNINVTIELKPSKAQVQDDTANWKIYSVSEPETGLHFQIKYPSHWEYEVQREGDFNVYFYPKHNANIPPRNPNDPIAPIELHISVDNPNESLKCLTVDTDDTCFDLKVDGVSAKRYTRDAHYGIVAFKKGRWLFRLISSKLEPSIFAQGRYLQEYHAFYNLPTEELVKIFNSMLSTFKFTDQEQAKESEEIKIIDGSIYRISPDGGKKLLIDKQKYSEERDYFQFEMADVSPDKTKILLFANDGLSLYGIYITSIDGAMIKILDYHGDNATWSPNSQYIIYLSKAADAGPMTRVLVYDTKNGNEVNISTKNNTGYKYLGFSNIRWLDDNSGIKVNYTAYDDIPYGNKIGEGETTFYLNAN